MKKSYFDEYFSDATKPTARNLFLIVVSILTLDIFRSVRFAHRHALSKISDTSLNAYYYALKTDSLDHESWRDVTLSKALKVAPDHLKEHPLFLSIDDTMAEKEGEKKKQTKLEIAAEMVRCAMDKIGPDRQVFLLCDSWYPKGCVAGLVKSSITLTSFVTPGLTLSCMTSRLNAQGNAAGQRNMANVCHRKISSLHLPKPGTGR